MRPSAVMLLTLCAGLACGCGSSRTFTIYSKPADAKLVINGVERGQGPITQTFEFGSGSSAKVTAVRDGYEPKTLRLTADTPRDTVVIELDPLGPKAVFSIEPAAMVRVNGQLVRPTPVRQAEVTLDPKDPEKTYTIVAEQTGYYREVRTVSGKDPQGYYRIALRPVLPDNSGVAQAPRQPDRSAPDRPAAPQTRPAATAATSGPGIAVARNNPPARTNPPPAATAPAAPRPAVPAPLRRDVVIRTDPPVAGAEIYIGGEKWGDGEVRLGGHEFKRDASGKSVPEQVSATAPGYEGGKRTMRYEDAKPEYVIALGRRRKDVRIATEPPGAVVTINGKPLPRDPTGVSHDTLYFPPQNPPGRPTTLAATVAPQDASGAWEPTTLTIGWDDGKKDYSVRLAPSRFIKVPMLRAVPTWDARGGWRGGFTRVDTTAARDVSEPAGRAAPQPLAELPAGTMLDSVVASPDGALVLYTELIAPAAAGAAATQPLRAQMRLLRSDGTPGPTLPSDGRHFDAMPSFTPDAGQVVFTSDRAGAGLDVWSMNLATGSVKQLARGGEKAALWPMIDASPSPRLFYEEFLRPTAAATEARSEVHVVDLEGNPPTNKALSPGTRPRASPRADAVVFTRADPVTGKRDLYMISDKGGSPLGGAAINLTNTPDVDECDPAWSRTGGKIAYAADGATDETGRRNYDLYVLSVSDPKHPVHVTQNGSWDDSPAWDPAGKSLYFRSNRGGKWGVWKVGVP